MTEVKPASMHFATVSTSFPWSRCRAIGTVADFSAALTMLVKYSKPAYLMALGVAATITGDLSSAEASTIANTVSRLLTLKAPTA